MTLEMSITEAAAVLEQLEAAVGAAAAAVGHGFVA